MDTMLLSRIRHFLAQFRLGRPYMFGLLEQNHLSNPFARSKFPNIISALPDHALKLSLDCFLWGSLREAARRVSAELVCNDADL
jgi:hypothetical protein